MALTTAGSKLFELRLDRSRNDLFDMLERLYGDHPG